MADVFDAMTHDRPYRKSKSFDKALAEIKEGAGKQFDPAVVNAFLKVRNSVALSDLFK
ncbi:Cyclic di-GMP phosphodiesterase [subsurface metagenome]